MKIANKKIKAIALIFGLAMSTSSCSDYFDLNDNPNLVSEQPINTFLTTVTHKTGLNSQRFANFIMFYTQHLANPAASGIYDTYQISDNSLEWNNAYWAMADLYDFKTTALASNAPYHVGIANILMAYHVALVNDTWGSAPFSTAFTPNNSLNPTYDSDEALYNKSLELVDEAIANLSSTGDFPAIGVREDLIYAGARTQWLKMAYAMKARLLNKISKKAAYSPQAILDAIDQAFTSNGDDAKMAIFLANQPWYQLSLSNSNALLGGWLSDNLINHLNGATYGVFDPRIEKITEKTVNNNYVGTRNGQGNVGAANTVKDECYISRLSPLSGEKSPLYIITYAEMKFIEAEAALSIDRPRAYLAYLEGIRANMARLEVAQADVNTYLAAPEVAVGEAGLTKKTILKEKYIATYLNPEAWNDMRRNDYDYEGFRLPLNAQLEEPIRQVAYPQDEILRNGDNVPEQSSLANRLWFDTP